jgi:WD40 repeat protein
MTTSRLPDRLIVAAACLAGCLAAGAAGRPTPVTACTFTPDGSALVVAHQDRVVVRAASDGASRQELPPEALRQRRVTALTFSPDGNLLAVAGGTPGVSGRVVLWDWGKVVAAGEIEGFGDVVTSVAFSPDGARLATASADRSADVYHVRDGGRHVERAARLAGHAGAVHAAAFGPGGDIVVTAGGDRSLKVWNAADGRLLRTLGNHTAPVHSLAVRPRRAGNDPAPPWTCASASDDQTVRVWQPEIGRMVRIVRGHAAPVLAVAYARAGALLLSAGAEGVVRAIDAEGDRILFQWNAGDDWVYGLAVSPDGTTVATGDWSGAVRVWDLGERGAQRRW